MFRVKRRDCLLLALMLAVSLIALSGHATVHAKAGTDQCLMCASHSDPHSVIPAQFALTQALIEQGGPLTFPSTVTFHTTALFTLQPRAPPATS